MRESRSALPAPDSVVHRLKGLKPIRVALACPADGSAPGIQSEALAIVPNSASNAQESCHMTDHFIARPAAVLRGSIRVPGDKSISHRSIMLGAIADGTTRIEGFLEGAYAISTMNVFRALGVAVEGPLDGQVSVTGVGLHGLKQAASDLDCGNSGTSMRLLCGLLAGQAFDSCLIGDESLSRRPMKRVTDPLAAMGASIRSQDGRPPLRISAAGKPLKAIDYVMPIASAQVKSSLMLAGLYAEGTTRVTEPAPTRDQMIATCFNRLPQQSNEAGSNPEEFRIEQVADRVKTNGLAFMGLTTECARCHDHKFDPISTKEYYSLGAFFNNIDELGLFCVYTGATPPPSLLLFTPEQETKHEQAKADIASLEKALAAERPAAVERFQAWLKTNRPPRGEPWVTARNFKKGSPVLAGAPSQAIGPRAPITWYQFETTTAKVLEDTVQPKVHPQAASH
jgi:hypothetical protein